MTVEELLRGWLAELGRHHNPHRQIIGYAKLQRQIETFANWVILPWDSDSAELFLKLRTPQTPELELRRSADF